MKNDKKERVVVWLRHSQVQHMNSWLAAEGCANQTELVEKALAFYLGYLTTRELSELIDERLAGAINSTLAPYAKRVGGLLYRLSVEVNTAVHVIARHFRADEEERRMLRAFAEQEVDSTDGTISFRKAVAIQREG